MASVGQDTLIKVSTEAATEFVESFYRALETNRQTLASFYSPMVTSILFNGNIVADGAAVQDIFANQMPRARYEVQSYDCQIINSDYHAPGTAPQAPTTGRHGSGAAAQAAKKMSLLVLVSGSVRFGDDKEARDLAGERGFSETFVLVPNPQYESGPKGRGKKQFLIQSQNFRLVV
ncbi:hypothetical protein VTO42DRAFT_3843 [Malbranchea cinnamomea]